MLVGALAFYSTAAVLRIWMATTMRSPQEKASGGLSVATFKTSLSTMAGMLLAGGVLTWIFITDGAGDIAFRLSGELMPIYLEKIGGITLQQIGLLGSINGIAMMFIPLLSGKMADRYGERIPIFSGFVMLAGAFAAFLYAGSFYGFALSWALFGFGAGMFGPAYQSLISKVVPAKMLGTFTGVFQSSLGFLSLPAPWLGAQLWERFNPRLPFMITGAVAVLVLPIVWFKFKLPKTPDQPLVADVAAEAPAD
jgi:MFS family permease